eukprot:7001013-Prymnesium_polylepis.1
MALECLSTERPEPTTRISCPFALQVSEWTAQPLWLDAPDSTTGRRRGGQALINYVAPGSEPSVVMGRHLDNVGMPKPVPTAVVRHASPRRALIRVACTMGRNGVQYLWEANISRLVVGHTPHGNCPT